MKYEIRSLRSKGFLQILKNSLSEKGMDKELSYTEIMLDEINRINGLVSEFLLLSKPKDTVFYKSQHLDRHQ